MKVGVLITVRLKSSRLKRKALKNLGGKPLVCHLIDRMKLVESSMVSLITSNQSSDDELEELAKKNNINCFRGDPVDVLERMRCASQSFGLDYVLSVTGDNPWVCPIWSNKLLKFAALRNLDFAKTEGLPFGAFSYVLKSSAIGRACEIKDEKDTEVWGNYFSKRLGFNSETLSVSDNSIVHRPELRLTVDTFEDFLVAEQIAIFEKEHGKNALVSLEEIVEFLISKPEIVALNRNIKQLKGKEIKKLNEMTDNITKVFVTGADGFIGSHLVEELIRQGVPVRAFVMYNSFGFWGWLDNISGKDHQKLEVVLGDVRDTDAVKVALAIAVM